MGMEKLKQAKGMLIALALAGAALGWFSQSNWSLENREALGLARALAGIGLGLLFYPVLTAGLARLWARLCGLGFMRALNSLAPLAVLPALALWYPDPGLTQNGTLGLAVLLALGGGLLAGVIEPRLSAPVLLSLGILAVLCVLFHDNHLRPYDIAGLERGLKGDASALFRYRVLVHHLASLLASALGAPVTAAAFMLRAFCTLLIFLVSIRVCSFWLPLGLASAAPLAHLAFLPFSFLFFYLTDEVEVLGAWLLLWAVFRQKHLPALLVMLFFTLNRELLIFLGPWYFFYSVQRRGWSLGNPAWRYAAAMVLGVIIIRLGCIFWQGFSYMPADAYFRSFNLDYLSAWAGFLGPERLWLETAAAMGQPLAFAGGAWLVVMLFARRLPRIIRWGLLINLPFFWLLQFLHGGFNECRELYPIIPFVVTGFLCLLNPAQECAAAEG